ncbi:hypothetical protein B0H14DRAFT_2609542 [Mycena olivaceomarginata]|nr:hypothetical protein B0H14DRAFT_2609542 [Mycena olivaceomarginata]
MNRERRAFTHAPRMQRGVEEMDRRLSAADGITRLRLRVERPTLLLLEVVIDRQMQGSEANRENVKIDNSCSVVQKTKYKSPGSDVESAPEPASAPALEKFANRVQGTCKPLHAPHRDLNVTRDTESFHLARIDKHNFIEPVYLRERVTGAFPSDCLQEPGEIPRNSDIPRDHYVVQRLKGRDEGEFGREIVSWRLFASGGKESLRRAPGDARELVARLRARVIFGSAIVGRRATPQPSDLLKSERWIERERNA